MSNLYNRFLLEMFDKKQVRCHSDIYFREFESIWPCEWYFRQFLSSTTNDLRIEYAKKIYMHLRAFEDVILPEFTISNVISLQTTKLSETNAGYVPQDHVIHSINLYILGIYIFFNFPPFHKKILSEELANKMPQEKIQCFIKKWKAFSLYHDVGYFLEANIDKKGTSTVSPSDLLNYQQLHTHLLFEYVTRSVARTILTAAIAQRSHRTFTHHTDDSQFHKIWRSVECEVNTSEGLRTMLSEFEGALMIEDVQSDRAFSHFVFVLDTQNVLMILLDEEDCPVGYALRTRDKISKIYIVKDSILDRSDVYTAHTCKQLFEKLPLNCHITYCIQDAENSVYAHMPQEHSGLANHYYEKLPQSLHIPLSFADNDTKINQNYIDIYRWLIRMAGSDLYNNRSIPEFDIYKQSISSHYITAINCCLGKHIQTVLKNAPTIAVGEINNVLQEIAKSIQNKKTCQELISAIHQVAEQLYSEEEGIAHDMLNYYEQTYQRVSFDFSNSACCVEDSLAKRLDSLKFIEQNGSGTVQIKLFANGDYPFEKNLYNKIRELSQKLQIDFDRLTTYSTDYTKGDHGLVSAGMLYQATVFAHYLAQYSKEHNDMKLAWHGVSGYTRLASETDVDDYAQVIFAILLHNIYTRKSNSNFGVDYQQSIEFAPFSFFCAFCDTFQKWHRPKQLDYSKTNLTANHFLGNEFDLVVTDEKICLKCNAQDAISIRKRLEDENMYLPGVLYLVHISEY